MTILTEEKELEQIKEEEIIASKETHDLLHMSEINILVDGYDDIFSDFDPRPYSQRSLSIDFLEEARRASRDKSFDGIELEFLVPVAKRDENLEVVLRKRLHDHFKRHHALILKDINEVKREGTIKTVIGFIMMLFPFFVDFISIHEGFVRQFLLLMFEPAGWFFFWTGLETLMSEWKKYKLDLEFYDKMSKGKIKFNSY